ncbi:MAG: hypothetical protein A3K10_02855 [Bacteroidetes bacterium RIFCSPLOWO2_12_FULL_31_6]|nr:MAG: hypothetical protein A3K10_02855 [Bacteroidetes bacterium RIFCSPLOWO2_12_FULL_31_6]
MQSILIDLNSQKDMSFLLEFVKRMGYKSRILTDEEKEDMGLLKAMKEGRKGQYVSRETVMKKLDKWL